jgi:DNA-binding response OmpR family regulator
MVSELLKLSGIKSEIAHSAAEARRMISTQRFDLYLLDVWMPELDGFEFCRQIRSMDSNTPILFYSGAAYERDREMGIDAGANAYLVKPEVEGLVEAMSGLIAEARKLAIRRPSNAIGLLIEANQRAKFFATSGVLTEAIH